MKKTFLSLGILSALAFNASAQEAASSSEFKPSAGNITVEVNALSPFSSNGAAPFSLGSPNFGNNAALRLRYFLSEGLAVRVQFAVAANRQKQDYGSVTDFTNNTTGNAPVSGSGNSTPISYKVTSSSTLISIAPGLEIHKNVSERLSVYYGAYVDFAIQSAKGKVEGTTGSSSSNTNNNGTNNSQNTSAAAGSYTYESKGASFYDLNNVQAPTNSWGVAGAGSGVNITGPNFGGGYNSPDALRNGGQRGFTRIGLVGVLGADYYITKALYLGLEVGWGFATTSYKKVTVEENATNINTSTTTNGNTAPTTPAPVTSATRKVTENKDSALNFSPVVNAAFRLGFWF